MTDTAADSQISLPKDFLSDFQAEALRMAYFRNGLEEVAFWGMQRILLSLQRQGIFLSSTAIYSMDDILKKIEILPAYHKQLYAILGLLVERKILGTEDQSGYRLLDADISSEKLLLRIKMLTYQYPELQGNIDILDDLLDDYLDILSGKERFLDILFPEGSFDTIASLYEKSPESFYFNQASAKIVKLFMDRYAQNRSVNILEIGAGIGSVTAHVLPLLSREQHNTVYHFTDISPAFLNHSREKFEQYADYLVFSRFDVNMTVEDQDFIKSHYDIILAGNALHNARDISRSLREVKSLLRPGGVLILNEGVVKSDYSTLVYGLSSAWWACSDSKLRIPGTPLFSTLQWEVLFHDVSFESFCSIGVVADCADKMSQDVMFATNGRR
ncbi:MAG: class I SAM-dependent methyltransferase [Gammaproteobacteria bacterium]|nr:class I SAM-dependent methyltransferase [Gammaproteobacteria bacterium]